MKHIRYFLPLEGARHPKQHFKELGINYQYAVPVSLADAWFFFNCENVPDNLPDYIKEWDVDIDTILSLTDQQKASIKNYKKSLYTNK